eukprot:gene15658-17896_t
MNLVGTIPDSIGAFSQLAVLEVESNSLSGDIPHSIYTLTNLTYLALDDNAMG